MKEALIFRRIIPAIAAGPAAALSVMVIAKTGTRPAVSFRDGLDTATSIGNQNTGNESAHYRLDDSTSDEPYPRCREEAAYRSPLSGASHSRSADR
jgi:hypothetical protein